MTSRRVVSHNSPEAGELLLGIDVGTTFCKATVMNFAGVELAHGRRPTPWKAVSTGAELDPASLVDTVLETSAAALGRVTGRIVGLGVTSMAETGVLLGNDGRPVTTSIAWYDSRGDDQAGRLAAALGRRDFVARTGLRVGRVCTAAKVAWQLENLPEATHGVRWLGISEWIVRSLGGAEAAEFSLASRTGWLDRSARAWWPEALTWSGAPAGLPAVLVDAGTPLGRVGLGPDSLRGAVLTVGGHDHLCAAAGAGAVAPGDLFNSCGSAEAFVRALEQDLGADEVVAAVEGGVTVGWHAVPGRPAVMGGFESGLVMKRTLDRLAVAEDDREALDAAVLRLPDEGGGDKSARVWLETIESLAAKGRHVMDAVAAVAGPAERLVVTGGAARSQAVRVVKRRVLGPFVMPPVAEAGARGAALFAGCAAGVYPSIERTPPL